MISTFHKKISVVNKSNVKITGLSLTPCPLQLKSTHQHKSGSVRLRLSSLVQSDFFISHFSSGEPERNLVVVCHNSTTPFFLEHSSAQRKLWQTESSKSKEDLGEKVMLINSTSCRQRGTGFTVQNAFAAPILDHMKQAMFGARICR